MRSKQAVRHSIVRRRESLQHKPTLHGQHKTWLLVPFYYHKTGGGKNKIWICECVVKSSKKWVISFSQKQVLITLYKPEKLYDIRLGSLLLALFKKHINQRQICNTHVFKDTMHAKRKKNNKCLM